MKRTRKTDAAADKVATPHNQLQLRDFSSSSYTSDYLRRVLTACLLNRQLV